MQSLRPLACGGILICVGVDQLIAPDTQLAQRHASQIRQLHVLPDLDSRMLMDGKPDREWGTEPRHNTLIFIGRNLDRKDLNDGFRACLA